MAVTFDTNSTALVVVDVQNDFCSQGGYMDREGLDLALVEEMLPRLVNLVGAVQAASLPIITVRAIYGSDPNWYLSDTWLERARRTNRAGGHVSYRVCEKGAWGAELVDALRDSLSGSELLIEKHRYSAFFNTELDLVLRSLRIETMLLAGVATNVCVETTARDGFMRDYRVLMVEDCCAAYSAAEHEATLRNIATYFGIVCRSDEVAEALSGVVPSSSRHGALSGRG